MIELKAIQAALRDRNLSAVSRVTGINAHTLYRLVQGKTKPNQATLKLIAAYLARA